MQSLFPKLDQDDFGPHFGLLSRQKIELMATRRMIQAADALDERQLQPASLDLRLGARAYRVRASFLPGRERTVMEQLRAFARDEDAISLEQGAVLERGCVYVIPLIEHLRLPDSIAAFANPKSSTGRLDIFTRLITDNSEVFDRVARAYEGPLYAEVSPRSFSVRVRKGSKLNQIRFRRLNSQQLERTGFAVDDRDLRERHKAASLVDGELNLRQGLVVRVALSAAIQPDGAIGYRAQKHADIIDVDRAGGYRLDDYWDRIFARPDGRLILDPGEFYILASQERLHIPSDLAAEMVPIDPAMGEFRVHYAGFFDPGFGASPDNRPGARAVLEVRSHEVPFVLEDGQIIGRLVYEKMAEAPHALYGEGEGSNYQGQGLKLSKHFVMD
ncbi:2-deoxycytidine 5-triphosphate deaminase [Methylocella silvestris BL2]|uniref:2-deoxycytidine 5-triphosphate deaminase n=1 Tax=Methylocella silvestris (strain DSM 15510 / CIP 108128 / LMG 27833 / NCIMB 13906 / BL2) TaxID=395965 RepID=B8ELJ2_METSB|nr:2'-deoxycytidine 5'-triphosphate deaminase [Methylocella silvestris]ACK49986.1 2-deoxycytidine 5-triphosphate deaminase [Methylocella silvestris BL2]